MSLLDPERPPSFDIVSCGPEACMIHTRGALVAIRRAPFRPDSLAATRRNIELALETHPGGLVLLSAFRLDARFPSEPGHESQVGELAATLRVLDRALVANAVVVELGGIRAMALRTITRAVWTIARPRSVMQTFDRLTDAISWLVPHARTVGALEDPAHYVRAYRECERMLAALDAR